MRKHEMYKRIDKENHSPTSAKHAWARRLCAAAMAGTLMVGTIGSAVAADEELSEAAADAPIVNVTGPEQWSVDQGVSHITDDAVINESSSSTVNSDGTVTGTTTTTTTWETTTSAAPSSTTTIEGNVPDRPLGIDGTSSETTVNGNTESGRDKVDSATMDEYLVGIEAGNTNKVETTESESGTITESGTHTASSSTTTDENGFVSGTSSVVSGSLEITDDRVHQTDKVETTIDKTEDKTELKDQSASFEAIEDEEREQLNGPAEELEWTRDPDASPTSTPVVTETTRPDASASADGLKIEMAAASAGATPSTQGTVTYNGQRPSEKEMMDVLKDMFDVVKGQNKANLQVTVGDTTYTFDGTDLKGEDGKAVKTTDVWPEKSDSWSFQTNSSSVHAYQPRPEAHEDLEQTREVISNLHPGSVVIINDVQYAVSAGEKTSDGKDTVILTNKDTNEVLDTASDDVVRGLWSDPDDNGNKTLSIREEKTNAGSYVTNITLSEMTREPNENDTKAVLDGQVVKVNGQKFEITGVNGSTVNAKDADGNEVELSVSWENPVGADNAQDKTKWQLKWSAANGSGTTVELEGGKTQQWAFAGEDWERVDASGDSAVPSGTITYRNKLTKEEIVVSVDAAPDHEITWDAEGWERAWTHVVLEDGDKYIDAYMIEGTSSYITKAEWDEIYQQLLTLQRDIDVSSITLTVSQDGFTRLDGNGLVIAADSGNKVSIKTNTTVQAAIQKIFDTAKGYIATNQAPLNHLQVATNYVGGSDAATNPGNSGGSVGLVAGSDGLVLQSSLILKEQGEEDKDASHTHSQAWLREVATGQTNAQRMWVYCVGHKIDDLPEASYGLMNVDDLVLLDNAGNPLVEGGKKVTAGEKTAKDGHTYADHLEYITLNGYWGDMTALRNLLPEGTSSQVKNALDDGIALAVTQAALWRYTNGLHAQIDIENVRFRDIFGKAWDNTSTGHLTELTDNQKEAAIALYKALATGTLAEDKQPTDVITKEDVKSVAVEIKGELSTEEVTQLVENLNKQNGPTVNENLDPNHVDAIVDAQQSVAEALDAITGTSAYTTDMSITIAVVPSQLNSNDMTVLVYQGSKLMGQYKLDPNAKSSTASTVGEDGTATLGVAAAEYDEGSKTSTWTLPGLTLFEGVEVELKLQGTQDLGKNAYLLRTEATSAASQPFVGLTGQDTTSKVDITMNVDFSVQKGTDKTHTESSSWTETETATQTDSFKQHHSQQFTVNEVYEHDVTVETTVTHTSTQDRYKDVFLAVWGDEGHAEYEPEPTETPAAATPAPTPTTTTPVVETAEPAPTLSTVTGQPAVVVESRPEQSTLGEEPEFPGDSADAESVTLSAEKEPSSVNPAAPDAPHQETLAEEPEFPVFSEERTLTAQEVEETSAERTPFGETEPEAAVLRTQPLIKTADTRREEKRTPKTGDDSMLSFWKFLAFAAVISIIGFAATLFSGKKKDEEA